MRNRFWLGLFGTLSRCLAAPDPSLAHCAAQPEPAPPIRRFPCLNASRVLQLPLTFGDPIARQVPLFIRWEDWHEYLPQDLRKVNFVQIGANCGKNTINCAVAVCLTAAFAASRNVFTAANPSSLSESDGGGEGRRK